ncbi:uncharacterized protein LOC130558452 [Triplophysa rosa]|uniref:Uncharacterized protein n=1 Tax=Triplophysa rosa TaxID=992332 RepID=A0A9W8C3H5_TRIRA|nr:uncharacterized protein LOC130558452 [Triplophysa rosa]XP_057196832.1 uncharacterized protein LOC130558452 [Triplophysa rosa]KAI7806219.1 hypothetical protein IRJ41_002306 [Triplophysa rosa]
MSHLTCMSLPRKRNVLKSSCNLGTCKAQSSSHTAIVNAVRYSSIKTSAHNSSPRKVKCLKTRKERNQIRGQERIWSHTCLQHSRKVGSEKAQHNGCHSVVSSRKDKSFAKPFLPHKPSIITEGRLTSIRGLFSHEVRSIDIERVVSEQLKTEKQRKDKRKRSVMHVTPPLPRHPPLMPESDQDCILDAEVQEPLQEPEKTTRDSRKELRKPPSALQTNKEDPVPKELSRQDEKHYRSANTVKKDTNNKSRPHSSSSLKGTCELMVLSLPENQLAHQFCSTPADNHFLYFQEIDSPKSQNENNRTGTIDEDTCAKKIQRFESTSAMERLREDDVRQSKSDPFSSELDSGTGTLTENDRVQISVSVREVVNKLAARLELHVPRRPLLAECRDVLLQALQKTHSFHLQHNLRKLHSFIDGKQTSSFGSGQTHEDCSQICFSHALGNEESEPNGNTDIWTENAIQQEYIAEKVKQYSGRGASMKKRRVQAERRFSPPVSLIQPLQSNKDMFDQSRPARLSQDCFKTQHYPSTTLFQQDEAFSQLPTLQPCTPPWANPYYKPCSQQLLGDLPRRGESMKNEGLDLISHQSEEKTDPMFNLNPEYENRKQKAQETFLGESSFWSNQLQVQDVRDRWAPLSFSTSFPSECFQYKPFFRYPHPSNSRDRSDWHSMTLCVRSNTPDKVFYHHWE